MAIPPIRPWFARAPQAIHASMAGGRSRLSRRRHAAARRIGRLVFATGFAENAAAEKWAPTDRQTSQPRVDCRRASGIRARRSHVRRAPAPLGRFARQLQAQTPDAQLERARQRLESLSGHGHFQSRPQRVAVRDRPRPRHRFQRFQSGLPGRRAYGAGRGSRTADAPGRHAEKRWQRLSPVPAADTNRQRRDRRWVQRRSALARARRRGIRARDRQSWTCSTQIVPFEDDPGGKTTMRDHLEASLRYTLEAAGAARTAADRPGRLERLPQPQRTLDRSRRVVPDRADAHERPRASR